MNMRIRLTLAFVLVVLVAIFSLVLLVRVDTANQVRQYMFRGGMVGVEDVVSRLEAYYQNNGGSWVGVEFLFQPGPGKGPGKGMGMGPGGGAMMMNQRIQIAHPDGSLIYDSSDMGATLPPLPPSRLQNGVPLQNSNGQLIGYLLINEGVSTATADPLPLVNRLNNAALTAALIAGGIALVLALILSSSFLRPISQLTLAAEHLAGGERDLHVPVRGSDELATLGRAFNSMTESLRQSEERRQAMTADIAHELRTPLAVQRAQLEALQDGVYPPTPENLQPLLNQNVLLSHLVDDLRTLALADAGELQIDHVRVDIERLVGRVLEQFRPAAETRSITLQQSVQKCPLVWGDPLRLEQILNNLLSNAVRHTLEGGKIEVSLHCLPDWVEIRVRDSGPGIDPQALPHLFERFYRADSARSREEGGTGLGLAIARQLALAHGGTLEASNAREGGAVFTLRLPVLGTSAESETE